MLVNNIFNMKKNKINRSYSFPVGLWSSMEINCNSVKNAAKDLVNYINKKHEDQYNSFLALDKKIDLLINHLGLNYKYNQEKYHFEKKPKQSKTRSIEEKIRILAEDIGLEVSDKCSDGS
jgi:hypothetical protein